MRYALILLPMSNNRIWTQVLMGEIEKADESSVTLRNPVRYGEIPQQDGTVQVQPSELPLMPFQLLLEVNRAQAVVYREIDTDKDVHERDMKTIHAYQNNVKEMRMAASGIRPA